MLLDVLRGLSEQGISVEVFVTEARPTPSEAETNGTLVHEWCQQLGLQCQIIPDTSVAVYMPQVDNVLLGAEAVMANGGIVNKIGSFQTCLIANHFNKPVYVFCELHKCMQEFPLGQEDVFDLLNEYDAGASSRIDYTPPEHIELFFTDYGIFTPSAITEELT